MGNSESIVDEIKGRTRGDAKRKAAETSTSATEHATSSASEHAPQKAKAGEQQYADADQVCA